ncbi:hypothetical protein J0670_28545, partial [Streptomyces sp. FH025]|nr:hypothetical protein [Streptomyces sp. FH025]
MHAASFLVFPLAAFPIAWTWPRPLWRKLTSTVVAAFCSLVWLGAIVGPKPAEPAHTPVPAVAPVSPSATETPSAAPAPTPDPTPTALPTPVET